jgi:hypothetical protein
MPEDTNETSDSANAVAAEYAATALDVYQQSGRNGPPPGTGPDHRTDRGHADVLVRDLLTDLMHYADLREVDFDAALAGGRFAYVEERTEAAAHQPGALVQLTGTAATQAEKARLPHRGVVTELQLTPGEPAIYKVRCPGEAQAHPFAAEDLEPAPPFGPVTTRQKVVHTPLAAEQAMVEAIARITLCDEHNRPAEYADIEDYHVLLGALTAWTRRSEAQLTEPLVPRMTREAQRLATELAAGGRQPELQVGLTQVIDPAQLAAQDFPFSLAGGVPSPSERAAQASRLSGKEPTRGRGRHRARR